MKLAAVRWIISFPASMFYCLAALVGEGAHAKTVRRKGGGLPQRARGGTEGWRRGEGGWDGVWDVAGQ
jgi:hypothetical protein